MVLPISNPYPVISNVQTARTSAALPALGAWDATPTVIASAGMKRVTLFFVYTRGGAGGAFDYQVQASPYSADLGAGTSWFNQALYEAGALAAGADTHSLIQQEYATYTATGATAESFVFGPFDIPNCERIRVAARESGNAGAPGTLQIIAVFGEV